MSLSKYRCISRELHVSRHTVKKYIAAYEEALNTSENAQTAASSYLSSLPVYKLGARTKLKLTVELQSSIDSLLALNREKKVLGMRKQLMKKKDIFLELRGQGYEIGYTTVCNYIRSKETHPSVNEAYIRQVYTPGAVCEFDWGEIKLNIGGSLVRLYLAVFTSAYSNYRYGYIYNRQDTISFMETHVRFFEQSGGVYQQMVYDNMRVALAKYVGRHEKEPTVALLQLRGHYGFSHRFCNAYRGNEKGHVERSVEYIRRKAFGLKYQFRDISEAESWLFKALEKLNGEPQSISGKSANELLEEERSALGVLPSSRLGCCEQVQLRVDKYATVCYRTNRYSVPEHLVGEFVDVSVGSNRLEVRYQNRHVASHSRNFAKHAWIIDITHYLSTFKKKPGALPGSMALAGNVYLKNLYHRYFEGDARNFIDLLSYCRDHKLSEEKIEETVNRLLCVGAGTVTTEKLRALLGNRDHTSPVYEADKISVLAMQQLTELTTLMNQLN